MKVSGLSVVLVLVVVGATHGFTDLLRFGANAARGAMTGASQFADNGIGGVRGMAGNIPLAGQALNVAQNAIRAANSTGQSVLNKADQTLSLGSLVSAIISNPLILQIVSFVRQILTRFGLM